MAQNTGKRVAVILLVAVLVIQPTACGTILHPERRGQPAGRLDPGIVLLDGIGLLLFLIPGVIAFAVDFTTGTIYLPPEGSLAMSPTDRQRLQTLKVDPAQLTAQKLSMIVSDQTGKSVQIESGNYRAAKIGGIEEFTPGAVDKLKTSSAAEVTFRAARE
jgi:hypothetical protein